jgi:hypothetical protein
MQFIPYIKKHYRTITLTSYLLPILFAVIVSLAHVVTFWEVTNPASWAIFLSVAVEVAVLSSIAASKLSNWAWFPFSIVTLIQIIGNVFFSYTNIDVNSSLFKNWVELFDPLFNWLGWATDGDIIVHKRILATFSGAMIPLISITFFHFFIRTMRMEPEVTAPAVSDEPKAEETSAIEPETPEVTAPAANPPVGSINRVTGEVPDLIKNTIPMEKEYHFPSPDHSQPPLTIETLPELPMNGLQPNDPYGVMITTPMEPAMRMDHFSPVTIRVPEPESVTKDELPEISSDYAPSEAQKAIDNMTTVPRELLQQPFRMVSNEVLPVMAMELPEAMRDSTDPAQLKLFEPSSAQDGIVVYEDEKKK